MNYTLIMMFFLAFYTLMTIVTFVMYGIDKSRAKKHLWRIPESTLLWFAALFGGLGAFLGMKIFHHKTKHTRFKILVPAFLIFQIVIIAVTIYFLYIR